MGRWQPSDEERELFHAKIQFAKSTFKFIKSKGPIKEGCYVKYFNVTQGFLIDGEVTEIEMVRNQKTFTIEDVRVRGRNLYKWIVEHRPGEKSKAVREKINAIRARKDFQRYQKYDRYNN